MPYSVELRKRAEKALTGMPADIQRRVAVKINALQTDPRPDGVKKLGGTQTDTYRVRVGDYRVLFQIDDAGRKVLILDIADRKEAYR